MAYPLSPLNHGRRASEEQDVLNSFSDAPLMHSFNICEEIESGPPDHIRTDVSGEGRLGATYVVTPSQDDNVQFEGQIIDRTSHAPTCAKDTRISDDSSTFRHQATYQSSLDKLRTRESAKRSRLILTAHLHHYLRHWWKEWALLLFSLGVLVAIPVILSHFNGQPQPVWSLGLNLSTIIAVLATLLRSSLATVSEEVMSQAKWSWQSQLRPVRDLAHFEEASRGPLAALYLFINIPKLLGLKSLLSRNSVVPASTAILLSLAIGAFTQQAIKSVPCKRAVQGINATIPVARYAHPFMNQSEISWTKYRLDAATRSRIMNGFSDPNSIRPKFLENCPTGDCSFESLNNITHVTSGFCSRCVETTNMLVKEDLPADRDPELFPQESSNPREYIVRLPNRRPLVLSWIPEHFVSQGMSVNIEEVYRIPKPEPSDLLPSNATVTMNIVAVTRSPCSPGYKCSGLWPDPGDVGNGEWKKLNVVSASCGLYPCAQHLKAETRNGEFVETIIHEELYGTTENNIPKVNPITAHW
ncbi:unnamed protein product [Periconia digitata]|uniref:Uncharacterized protein n=1 Tax=Periconia digitata TaxID=1303443 RepID=A0A9W4XE18_9PLEO|nr:unnamed protein product [Periconia digitata]